MSTDPATTTATTAMTFETEVSRLTGRYYWRLTWHNEFTGTTRTIAAGSSAHHSPDAARSAGEAEMRARGLESGYGFRVTVDAEVRAKKIETENDR